MRTVMHSDICYFRDYSRYNYLHSIERDRCVGQRLSIMIRVGIPSPCIRQCVNSMFRIAIPFPYPSDSFIRRRHVVPMHALLRPTLCMLVWETIFVLDGSLSLLCRLGYLFTPRFAADLSGHCPRYLILRSSGLPKLTRPCFEPSEYSREDDETEMSSNNEHWARGYFRLLLRSWFDLHWW